MPCPRAAMNVLTRWAADSVREIVMSSILPLLGPVPGTVRERIFDHQQASEFLGRYGERLGPLGARVGADLRGRLAEAPSFVAFEGYDTVTVLADVLRSRGVDRERIAESWPRVAVEGTRGLIQFSRTPGNSVWQWAWPPVQVVDRDPAEPDHFRVLHTS